MKAPNRKWKPETPPSSLRCMRRGMAGEEAKKRGGKVVARSQYRNLFPPVTNRLLSSFSLGSTRRRGQVTFGWSFWQRTIRRRLLPDFAHAKWPIWPFGSCIRDFFDEAACESSESFQAISPLTRIINFHMKQLKRK